MTLAELLTRLQTYASELADDDEAEDREIAALDSAASLIQGCLQFEHEVFAGNRRNPVKYPPSLRVADVTEAVAELCKQMLAKMDEFGVREEIKLEVIDAIASNPPQLPEPPDAADIRARTVGLEKELARSISKSVAAMEDGDCKMAAFYARAACKQFRRIYKNQMAAGDIRDATCRAELCRPSKAAWETLQAASRATPLDDFRAWRVLGTIDPDLRNVVHQVAREAWLRLLWDLEPEPRPRVIDYLDTPAPEYKHKWDCKPTFEDFCRVELDWRSDE